MGKLRSSNFLAVLLAAASAAVPLASSAQTLGNPALGGPSGTAPEINNPASGNVAPPPVDGTAPSPKPKAKQKTKKQPATSEADKKHAVFRGKLSAIDKTAMTITVEGAEKRNLKITSNTRINKDGKPALLADGKVGEDVSGQATKMADGSEEAAVVNFGAHASASTKHKSKSSQHASKSATDDALAPGTDSSQPATNTEPPASSATKQP